MDEVFESLWYFSWKIDACHSGSCIDEINKYVEFDKPKELGFARQNSDPKG